MQQSIKTSEALFAQAQIMIPGGVNSPVRAFRSVGGTPRFFAKAQGAYGWDADGNRYVDYICSWGPAIVGHAHPEVIAAVQNAAANGLSFGAPTAAEVEIAEWIRSHLPSMEMMRLTSSGRRPPCQQFGSREATRADPKSSSSKAAITAMSTAFWSRPAQGF